MTGPGATTDGDVYGSSYYDLGASDGTYRAQVTPIKPGTFKLYISLNGIEIKDSPFNVTVKIGKPSNVTSQLTGIAFPKNVLAGVSFEFTLELYDAFGNKLNAEPEIPIDIDSVALFQSSSYTSPIGVPDIANFDTVTGKDFGGAVASNDDGTYKITYTVFRAGTFNLTLNINGNPLTGLPGVLNIQPSEIEPDNCVIKTTPATSYVAGATLVFEYQCRDMYHNNVQVLAASFTSTSICSFPFSKALSAGLI